MTVIDATSGPIVGAFLIGLAVASAPGPVQTLILVEAARGGLRRGGLAVAGAAFGMSLPLFAVAAGVAVARPDAGLTRALAVVGGGFTLWIAIDSFRSAGERLGGHDEGHEGSALDPLTVAARVGLAVLLFPGTWIFLVGVAAPLLTSARVVGGSVLAFGTAISLVLGTTVGNLAIGGLVGWGGHRSPRALLIAIRRLLSCGLAVIALALLIGGLAGEAGMR